jgi:hypothetical protein
MIWAVLLVDECECDARAKRALSDASSSSRAGASDLTGGVSAVL